MNRDRCTTNLDLPAAEIDIDDPLNCPVFRATRYIMAWTIYAREMLTANIHFAVSIATFDEARFADNNDGSANTMRMPNTSLLDVVAYTALRVRKILNGRERIYNDIPQVQFTGDVAYQLARFLARAENPTNPAESTLSGWLNVTTPISKYDHISVPPIAATPKSA